MADRARPSHPLVETLSDVVFRSPGNAYPTESGQVRSEALVAEALDVSAAAGDVGPLRIELDRSQRDVAGLRPALVSNRDIGAAVSILMWQHRWTQDQSFDALRTASQHQHRKLHDVASEVLLTGSLPGGAPAAEPSRGLASFASPPVPSVARKRTVAPQAPAKRSADGYGYSWGPSWRSAEERARAAR